VIAGRNCPHTDVEPVEVRFLGEVEFVAQVCCDCLAALPANWGCTGCSWVEVRTLADGIPQLVPGTPCPTHAKASIL